MEIPSGTRKRSFSIIVADDDSDDRELFEEAATFADPGISITLAHDGEELMDQLLNRSLLPDMIFLDLNMPRKNGKECLTEIRAIDRLHGIPVIIYSTSLNPSDIEETFNQGARHFFRKPNSFEELKQILFKLLGKYRPVAEMQKWENFMLNENHKTSGS